MQIDTTICLEGIGTDLTMLFTLVCVTRSPTARSASSRRRELSTMPDAAEPGESTLLRWGGLTSNASSAP